jgi:hypothetical protein
MTSSTVTPILLVRQYRNGQPLCMCGCGSVPKQHRYTQVSRGLTKGNYYLYCSGHNKRRHWTGPNWIEEDRGFGTSCWIWQRAIDPKLGYGHTTLNGEQIRVHRAAYIEARGEIPKGYDVHHRCAIPACVNPDHLEALPRADHAQSEVDPRSKLNREQVREMRLRTAVLTCGHETAAKILAPDYGVSEMCVLGILRRRHWKNV